MLLAFVAACGGSGATAVVTTTTVRPTTTTTTTSTSPTTSSAPDTTASTQPADGFRPSCVELEGTASTPPVGDPALDVAAPMGAEPVMQLQLPTIEVGDVTDTSRVRVWRILGGMLVELTPYNDGTLPAAALLAVDATGAIRWRRCLERGPDMVAVAAGEASTEVVVGWTTYGPTGPERTDLEVWSLADGSPSRTWDDVLAANGISGAATEYRTNLLWGSGLPLMVLGPRESRPATADDTVLVVELATMTLRELPYPPTAVGGPVDMLPLELATNGGLMVRDPSVPWRIAAIATGTGWSTDPATIATTVGIRADFFGGDEHQALRAIDAEGTELWRRDDLLAPPFEGFHVALDGDVVAVSGCAAVDFISDTPCTDWTLAGVDAVTGRTLWERAGNWAVSGLGGGVALVSGPWDGSGATHEWTMIDLTTGLQMGDRSWDEPWSFGEGCCDEPARVYRSGGVVFRVDGTHLELWYPEAQSTPLQVVPFG
ncbi:MAG: hypothetical protein RL238_1788 [Actinomycetota bacterium]